MKPLLHSAPLDPPPVGHPSRRQVLLTAAANSQLTQWTVTSGQVLSWPLG